MTKRTLEELLAGEVQKSLINEPPQPRVALDIQSGTVLEIAQRRWRKPTEMVEGNLDKKEPK